MSFHVTVKLFGAFREWAPSGSVRLEIDSNCKIADVRRALVPALSHGRGDSELLALLNDSVFADERTTLGEEEKVVAGCELAVLPPVCGG